MPIVIEDGLKFAVTLVSILNPIGVIPIFLGMTEQFSPEKIKKISTSCSLAVIITINLSLLLGQQILNFFGISIASFTIGGGILLFTMAFSMISAKPSSAKLNQEETDNIDPSEIGIVPLAIPLLAGPGTISTAIIHSKSFTSTYDYLAAIFVIIIAGLLIKLTFSYSKKIADKIGRIGLNVMTRIMGLILLSISIEMILGGIKEILPVLKG